MVPTSSFPSRSVSLEYMLPSWQVSVAPCTYICVMKITPFITDVKIGPNPMELSPTAAFQILSIAHQYGFGFILSWCQEAFERSRLDLWPSKPIASSEVTNHPGLVQCLALADAKQCDSMVQSCLSQLIKPGADKTIRDALSSSHLYKMMDGLRSETKTDILCRMAGLPKNHKVREIVPVPSLLQSTLYNR